MFDLVSTVQQMMLMVMALAFMGVGGLLLGYEIHTRMRGVRVTAEILGVRETKPNMYHAVYRYNSPSGESIEATSSSGSSSTRGRDTGRFVEIFTFPNRPGDVCETGAPIAGLFGGFFFAVGLWPLHTALTSWPVTPLTWLGAAGMAGYSAYFVRRMLIPKGQRQSAGEWIKARRAERAAEYASTPIRRMEDVRAAGASGVRAINPKKLRFFAPVLIVIGIAALGLGVHLGQQIAHRMAVGVRAPGLVIALVDHQDSDGTSYYPVVRFTDETGEPVEFKDRIGSNPSLYHVGEAVTVLYERDAPAHKAMIDRGLWNWLPSLLLGLFGAVFTLVGLRLFTL